MNLAHTKSIFFNDEKLQILAFHFFYIKINTSIDNFRVLCYDINIKHTKLVGIKERLQ